MLGDESGERLEVGVSPPVTGHGDQRRGEHAAGVADRDPDPNIADVHAEAYPTPGVAMRIRH